MSQEDQSRTAEAEAQHAHGHWGAHDHAVGPHGHIHDAEHGGFMHTHAGEEPIIELTTTEAGNILTLNSVGIDVGSATSHLTFSKLVLERQGLALSSRFRVVGRAVTHRSPILLTPYVDLYAIDTEELSKFIRGVYEDAGMRPEDVDTGAIIFTGEAAKKDNAEAISALFAAEAGKFVCATAGPNLEAVMAAYGSGACARSESREGMARTVLNIDMGGGTAKFAVCRGGEIVDTAAINVGARLITVDERGRITRVEPAGQIIAEELDIPLEVGGALSKTRQRAMAELLADCLANVAEQRPLGRLANRLMITDPLSFDGPFDAVTFSGGVSEYVYGNESRDFGDLGIPLGNAIRSRAYGIGAPIEQSEEQIRATVIGAGQYTLQVSGSTIFVSRPGLLPQRNLQVVAPVMPGIRYTVDTVCESVQRALQRLDIEEGTAPIALSIRWQMEPSYERVRTLAEGIVRALPRTIAQRMPLTLIFDTDIAGAVGILLTKELLPGHDVVSIDEIQVADLDFIDLADEREDVRAVPVVVKSLVFTTPRERSSGLIWGTTAAPHLHERGREHPSRSPS